MRLVIDIPDFTSSERKTRLTQLTERLSARPELIDGIYLTGDDDDAAIQAIFTPALLAEIDAAGADISAGNTRTHEHVDSTIATARAYWLAANLS